MPFAKGFNRWALPQDMLDTETMKLTMVHNSWSLPVFKELFFVGKLADMDFNDAMSRKNMAALHETIIDKALFLFIMLRCAPQLRVVKPDLMKLFGDLMLDKNIAALLNKCNMTPSSRLAEYLASKVMLLAFCVRQTSRRAYRLQDLKTKASGDDEIKFSIINKTSDAFPERVDHEMTRRDMLDAVFKELADDLSPAKSGHGTSEGGASDTMSVRTMSFADEVAMELVIKEDDDGFPMPPG